MKLSDVKGERAFDVIVDCIEPVANIASDPKAVKLFQRERLPKGMTVNDFMMKKLKTGVPPLLKKHRRDAIKILSSIEGVSEKEYTDNLDAVKLLNDCLSLMTDESFLALFTSAQSGTEQTSSGSVQENTEDSEA